MVSTINPNFPVAGIDQPSQGFRDNFLSAKNEIEALQSSVGVLQSTQVTVLDNLTDVDTTTTPPTIGNSLTFNGTRWVPSTTSGLAEIVQDPTPQLGGNLDVNGHSLGDGSAILLSFIETSSAVNYFEIQNAQSTVSPIMRVKGSDLDVPLTLESKGTGSIVLDSSGSSEVVMQVPANKSFVMTGSSTGGSVLIRGGNATTVDGGQLSLRGGNTTNPGSFGGDVSIRPGAGTTASEAGIVRIRDAGNSDVARYVSDAAGVPVNYINFINARTGFGPSMYAGGTDANVNLELYSKGTGKIVLNSQKWPLADGTASQILSTDGAGTLSWGPAIFSTTASLNFPNITNGTSSDLTINLTGATLGSSVILGLPNPVDVGMIYQAWVSSAGVITVRASNVSAAPINPNAATFRVTAIVY